VSRLDSGKVSEALDHVERELTALWAPEEGSPPKARVCMANLVVLTSAASQARAAALVDALPAADTARTFLVTVDPRLPLWALDAGVSARCQRDGERLLCSERIDLSLGAGAVGRAASVISSLSMPEVPTAVVLLEPAPPMLVAALTREASRLVVDSEALGIDAAAGLARATAAHLVDLAWLRLYPWRNQIASAFDDPRVRPAVSAVQRVSITSTLLRGGTIAPASRLLLGWLASRLGWRVQSSLVATDARHQPIALDLGARLAPDCPEGRLLSFELSAVLGDAHMMVDLAREPHGTTLQSVCTSEGLGARVENVTLPEISLPALVDRALADPLPDAPLRQALQVASAPVLSGPPQPPAQPSF